LAGLQGQIPDDAVPLVQQAQHRDSFGHRRCTDLVDDIGKRDIVGDFVLCLLAVRVARGERDQRYQQE
jgi:hypothetical protein